MDLCVIRDGGMVFGRLFWLCLSLSTSVRDSSNLSKHKGIFDR